MNNKNRKPGYYWVQAKRTKIWMIARWWPSLNRGKGFWDTMRTIENDTRGGFSEVDERRIKRIEEEKPIIKRTRKHDTQSDNKKLSKPQKVVFGIPQRIKRHRRAN